MIRLERVTKRYPGQAVPAVRELDLDIPEGQIVTFVGPSGCGKTTLMKLINRLIEPSSGRIFLGGDDVTGVNPDRLRRRIGYVIQQIGLFPHMTIAANIAVVPKMIGWDRRRIDRRIDDLLGLVGLDPGVFRKRYPKQLSGGQRQRVGVARALAVDPPVMLMDEPFGAIDPITRERLQNELLRLQQVIRKTIVFVTHDIDEAIKLGDRIVIMRGDSSIAQYDTPEHILSNPADDYVADFIGKGAALKRLHLARVGDVGLAHWATLPVDSGRDAVVAALRASERGSVLLVDARRRPVKWISARDLDRNAPPAEVGLPPDAVVSQRASLQDALNEMVTSHHAVSIVVDDAGGYLGVIDFGTIARAVRAMRDEARDEAWQAAEALSSTPRESD